MSASVRRSTRRRTTSRGALLAIAWCCAVGAQAREPAPAPGCLDARSVEKVRASPSGMLLVAAQARRFALSVDAACAAQMPEPDGLVAEDGWICGGPREYVRAGAAYCTIRGIEEIDQREYSRRAMQIDRERRRAPAVALAPVEVNATRRKSRLQLRGDPDYCINPAAVRGWQFDGNDVVVQTSPRRAAGRRAYRLELITACPELTWLSVLTFRSGVGIGLICGNPGDRVIGSHPASLAGSTTPGEIEGVKARSFTAAGGCEVTAVYPEG